MYAQMKVLMLGWELPPLYAGGIGMVCYDLLKELGAQDTQVTYVMPFGPNNLETPKSPYTKKLTRIISAQGYAPKITNVTVKTIPTLIHAYQSPDQYSQEIQHITETTYGSQEPWVKKKLYGKDLFQEVDIFAKRIYSFAEDLDFDVVHAHDWMTFPAATGVADKTGKKFIAHVHNTIFDRYLGNASQHERDIEYNGLLRADKIIAISHLIKNRIMNDYGINGDKIHVIHNAPNSLLRENPVKPESVDIAQGNVVLFTGRITIQKGPEYFVQCAKKVLEVEPDTTFVMAGSGDMLNRMIDLAARENIGHKFLFTGFYNMAQAKALYSRADCYVMPSVSEPFGIVPLEAMDHGTPTIVSKTSGCSEVLRHTLKCDFWDTKSMANQVVSVLRYKELKQSLSTHGQREVQAMNWEKPTRQCIDVYNSLI